MDSFRCRLVLGLTDVSLKVGQFSVKVLERIAVRREVNCDPERVAGVTLEDPLPPATDDGGSTCAVTVADVFDLDAILKEDEEVDDIAKNSNVSLHKSN